MSSSSPYKAYLTGAAPPGSPQADLAAINSAMLSSPPPAPSPGSFLRSSLQKSAPFRSSDYVTPLSGPTVPQSNSKAVISALTALQQKIRRLESDKVYYEESAAVAKQEKDAYKDALERERAELQAAAAAREAQLREHNMAVQSTLAAAQDRMEAMARDVDALRHRVNSAEAVKAQLESALHESNERAANLSAQAANESFESSRRLQELELNQDIMRAETEARLKALQDSIREEREKSRDAELTNQKAKQTLREVLDVNESLLARVATDAGLSDDDNEHDNDNNDSYNYNGDHIYAHGSASSGGGGGRKSSRASSSSSSRRSSSKRSRRRAGKGSHHRRTSVSSSSSRRSARPPSGRILRGTAASRSKRRSKKGPRPELPFVVGKNAGKSFSVTANVQQAMSMLNELEPVVSEMRVMEASRRDAEHHHHHSTHSHSQHSHGARPVSPSRGSTTGDDLNASRTLFSHSGIDSTIRSLEIEFEELTDRYHAMRNQLEDVTSATPIDELNAMLRRTIEQMEARGDQIKALKRYRRSIAKTLDTTHAQLDFYRILLEQESRHHATPLKILRGIQQLQRQLRGEEEM